MELKNTEYEVDAKGIAIIWLNRPQRMNAWTGPAAHGISLPAAAGQ
jgi:enoyl-CoA hydratase/carnithine racemase